jgi:hypothetical protein
MVNTDGTAYVKYEVRNTVNNVVTSDTLYLMQINPDNSSSSTVLSATTQNETQYPGNIIPDGNGGVLATWSVSMVRGTQPTYPYEPVDFNGENDYYAHTPTTIAQLLSKQLTRGAYAYDVGMYFSNLDANHDPYVNGNGRNGPNTLPDYLIPAGAPGNKPNPLACTPQACVKQ